MENKFKNLCLLFGEIFAGNAEMPVEELIDNAAQAGLNESQLESMEISITKHPKYIKSGLPFPGDEAEYDELVKSDIGFKLIQEYMNFWD